MKSRLVRIAGILLALVAIVVVLRLTVLRPEPVPVTVFEVARGLVEQTLTNSKAGTVKTRQRAVLSPEIGGRVAVLPVREGERVRKGQLLLRIADEDYRATVVLRRRALATAEANEREACLAAEQARRDLARYRELAEDRIVSQELLDQYENRSDVAAAGCDGARARIREADAALELAVVEHSKTALLAPFDGVVAEISAEVGEWITPSPPALPVPPVIELIAPSGIYVSAPLDEVDLSKLEVGLPVRMSLDAYPDRSFDGRVSRVAPYVLDLEEHSRTVEIEAEFDDAAFASGLLPGASADIEIILDSEADALRIPSYALIEGSRVLLFEDERLVSREVTAGLQNWAFAEILEGLQVGDLVVVSLDRVEVQGGARAVIEAETLR